MTCQCIVKLSFTTQEALYWSSNDLKLIPTYHRNLIHFPQKQPGKLIHLHLKLEKEKEKEKRIHNLAPPNKYIVMSEP